LKILLLFVPRQWHLVPSTLRLHDERLDPLGQDFRVTPDVFVSNDQVLQLEERL
jgi:hypothetical protein